MKQDSLELTIGNDLTEVTRVATRVIPLLESWRVDAATAYRVHLVLEEVLSNVIRHGFEDEEEHDISVGLTFDGEHVEIRVRDDGAEFNPIVAPARDVSAALDERSEHLEGGFGLHLIRASARDMEYHRDHGRNELRIRI